MPFVWLPFSACRSFEKLCHVAVWEVLVSAVITVGVMGMVLAGKQGWENKERRKKKR